MLRIESQSGRVQEERLRGALFISRCPRRTAYLLIILEITLTNQRIRKIVGSVPPSLPHATVAQCYWQNAWGRSYRELNTAGKPNRLKPVSSVITNGPMLARIRRKNKNRAELWPDPSILGRVREPVGANCRTTPPPGGDGSRTFTLCPGAQNEKTKHGPLAMAVNSCQNC